MRVALVLCSLLEYEHIGYLLSIVNDSRKRTAIYIGNDIAIELSAMASKRERKENAKTRYDEKNPTVSFRVSIEERRRLDMLIARGTTFREIILRGAGIIENSQVKEQRIMESERKKIEEAAIQGALRDVALGKCSDCGMTMFWDLTNPDHRRQIALAVEKFYRHKQC